MQPASRLVLSAVLCGVAMPCCVVRSAMLSALDLALETVERSDNIVGGVARPHGLGGLPPASVAGERSEPAMLSGLYA